MKLVNLVVMSILILSLPLISAELFPTPTTDVEVGFGEGTGQTGVNIFIPEEILNVSNASVLDAEVWITNIGNLDDANSTQLDRGGDDKTLNIKESWLTTFGNNLWCALTGCTMTGDINMGGNNINDASNITINDNLFFGDINHFLRRGTENFNGLGTNAFSFHQNVEHPEGTIPFIVSVNKSNSDNDAVLIMTQSGLNESNSILGNSWFVVVNNLTNNLTKYSKCFEVADLLNETLRVQCDSADSGADFIVQDDIQSFGTVFADKGIRAETLVDFVMNGEDVNIQGGGLHISTPVDFVSGVTSGDEIITFSEAFGGGLGNFNNLQVDTGNWFTTADVLCDDGDCAKSIGLSGVGDIIIEANISTVNIEDAFLNFVYSLVNILGSDSFTVTANNNVGSGEVTLFTDSTNNVIKSSESVALPSSMWDQPNVGIRFICDATQPSRQCFVDTISVNGIAIATTLTNQSGFDSVIKFSDGTLAVDGFPERGIIYNASADLIIFRGNVTFESIIEQDLNITNSITLGGETIFDWDNISFFDDNVFLIDGSRAMIDNAEWGGFDLSDVNLISASIYQDTSLVLHHQFSAQGVIDSSIYGNDGTFNGGASTGLDILMLDGTDDSVSIPDSSSLDIDGEAFGFSVWLRPAFDQTHVNSDFVFDKTDGNAEAYRFFYLGSTNVWRFRMFTSSGTFNCDTVGLTWATNSWHQWAGFYNGTTISLYWDAQFNVNCDADGSITTNNDILKIGEDVSGSNDYEGSIDDLRIYNRAISSAEIQKLFNEEYSKKNVYGNQMWGLIAHFDRIDEFESGDGITLQDKVNFNVNIIQVGGTDTVQFLQSEQSFQPSTDGQWSLGAGFGGSEKKWRELWVTGDVNCGDDCIATDDIIAGDTLRGKSLVVSNSVTLGDVPSYFINVGAITGASVSLIFQMENDRDAGKIVATAEGNYGPGSRISSLGFWVADAGDKLALFINHTLDTTFFGNVTMEKNLQIGTSASPKNVTMFSPDGTRFTCGVNNSGGLNCN